MWFAKDILFTGGVGMVWCREGLYLCAAHEGDSTLGMVEKQLGFISMI